MSRIDTAAPASLFLQGYQTGSNTAETRLRRLQDQSQFEVQQQAYQQQVANRLRQEQEAKAQRQYAADAMHAALMEQLGRTSAMRPTYLDQAAPALGDVSGIAMPDVLNEPMPDETDEQWRRAADAARERGNVEGLQALLKEGTTREQRAENAKKLRYIRTTWAGNTNSLADDSFKKLVETMTEADDPMPLVMRHYQMQESERQFQARQAAEESRRARLQTEEQAATLPAYQILNDPKSTPDRRAQAQATLASRNAPFGTTKSPLDVVTEEEIDAALVGIPPEEAAVLKQAWRVSGKAPAPGTVAGVLRGGGQVQRQAADKALATAALEYEAVSNKKKDIKGRLVPPDEKDLAMANAMREPDKSKRDDQIDTGYTDFTGEYNEDDARKALVRVLAWEKYQAAVQARDAAYAGGASSATGLPTSAPSAPQGAVDADTLVDQLIDAGMSAEEIAAELRRRGLEQ